MKNIQNFFLKSKNNNTLKIIIIFLLIAFIFYTLYTCLSTQYRPKKETELNNTHIESFTSELSTEIKILKPESISQNEIVIVKFYAPWCGYCKKIEPDWKKITQKYHNKKFKNKIVKVQQLDCDKHEKEAAKHKIPGYPTIRIYTKGRQLEFEETRDFTHISNFIENFAS